MSSFILFHGDGIFKYLIKFAFTGKDQGFRLRVERADQRALKLSDSLTELLGKRPSETCFLANTAVWRCGKYLT